MRGQVREPPHGTRVEETLGIVQGLPVMTGAEALVLREALSQFISESLGLG